MFLKEVRSGMMGKNQGLSCGLPNTGILINKIQKKSIYAVGAATKTGKTTFVDYAFVLSPYLNEKKRIAEKKIRWIYYSYEIDRVSKMAKYAAFFMWQKYKIRCDANYILSKNQIMSEEHYTYIEEIYNNELVELFGIFDDNGKQTQEGLIIFREEKNNPTGIRYDLKDYAKQHGRFRYESYKDRNGVVKETEIGYNEADSDLFTIVIVDHVGLVRREKGLNKKDNIDRLSEYAVELRNKCRFTFVFVSQFNRGMGKIDRLKFSGKELQPTLEDFKDTGNIAEDANVVFTLFNPHLYPHLTNHLNYKLKPLKKSYRLVTIQANRDGPSGGNIPLFADMACGNLKELPHYDNASNMAKVHLSIGALSSKYCTSFG